VSGLATITATTLACSQIGCVYVLFVLTPSLLALNRGCRKFVNCMMRHGKKNTAQKIFDDMLSKLKVAQLSGEVSLGDRRGTDPSKPQPIGHHCLGCGDMLG